MNYELKEREFFNNREELKKQIKELEREFSNYRRDYLISSNKTLGELKKQFSLTYIWEETTQIRRQNKNINDWFIGTLDGTEDKIGMDYIGKDNKEHSITFDWNMTINDIHKKVDELVKK